VTSPPAEPPKVQVGSRGAGAPPTAPARGERAARVVVVGAGIAGLAAARLPPGATVVCVVTGHGLKDPEVAAAHGAPPVPVQPDPDAIAEAAR